VHSTSVSYAQVGGLDNLNRAITLVEKFLINEGLEGLEKMTNMALKQEVERFYIPVMQKNLILWKSMADKIMTQEENEGDALIQVSMMNQTDIDEIT